MGLYTCLHSCSHTCLHTCIHMRLHACLCGLQVQELVAPNNVHLLVVLQAILRPFLSLNPSPEPFLHCILFLEGFQRDKHGIESPFLSLYCCFSAFLKSCLVGPSGTAARLGDLRNLCTVPGGIHADLHAMMHWCWGKHSPSSNMALSCRVLYLFL